MNHHKSSELSLIFNKFILSYEYKNRQLSSIINFDKDNNFVAMRKHSGKSLVNGQEVRLKAVTIVTLLIASSNNPQWSLCLLSQRGISEFLNLGHELIYTANNATYFFIYTWQRLLTEAKKTILHLYYHWQRCLYFLHLYSFALSERFSVMQDW